MGRKLGNVESRGAKFKMERRGGGRGMLKRGKAQASASRLFFFLAAITGFCSAGQDRLQAAAATIQNGSTVAIRYVLVVERQVVDSTHGKPPLTYVHGAGQIVPGLEERLKGLKPGDKKHIVVPPGKAYGHVFPDAYQTVSKKSFRDAKLLKVGTVVSGRYSDKPVQATVLAIDGDQVTLNLNHPLAGKTLEFDVEVVDVQALKR